MKHTGTVQSRQAMGSLGGLVAIVTGGSVGIGLETACLLAREGAHVVVVSRNQNRLNKALDRIKAQQSSAEPMGLALNVTNQDDMSRMAEQALETFGHIDILVTAAGVLRPSGSGLQTVQRMSIEDWDEVIDTNLKGVFLANRAVLPAMIQQKAGKIINLSSTSGRKGLAFDSAYCASKFAVIGMSEALAEEVQRFGIRVQAILPGAIETDMWNQNGPLPPPRDILSPERVAQLIFYTLTMPIDTRLDSVVIEPLKLHESVRSFRL